MKCVRRKTIEVNWNDIANERFVPLTDNRDRYLLLWGGRGSSKSVFVAQTLLLRCLNEKYFRYILIKKTFNAIKDAQWETLKQTAEAMNIADLFEFKTAPLEIVCVNGNKFIARGCDDTAKLKSIKDPTGAWYEEDIPSEEDFITITTSIRSLKAAYLQEIFTFNPEVEGDYTQHWFYKKFFEGKHEVSFSSEIVAPVKNTEVRFGYTSHHSTADDNRFLPMEFRAFLESLKVSNPYYYTIYALGRWGNKQISGQFYKLFNYATNGVENKLCNGKPILYNNSLPLHISFDFNVNPYITCTVHQINGKRCTQIDEICLSTPDNTTSAVCREFTRRYQSHRGGLFIYGDPTGMQEDTRSERGYNDYVIIQRELAQFHPSLRVLRKAPAVRMRGDFINSVFKTNYGGLQFVIGYNCVHTINDYLFCKEAADGTKEKEKAKDRNTGVTCEKYGHTSDANDYLYTTAFASTFETYQRGGKPMMPMYGYNVSRNAY